MCRTETRSSEAFRDCADIIGGASAGAVLDSRWRFRKSSRVLDLFRSLRWTLVRRARWLEREALALSLSFMVGEVWSAKTGFWCRLSLSLSNSATN